MSEYLKGISSPADLKKLPDEAMAPLAAEIRSFLIENVTKTGGHLASNLGIVELTLALERNLDLPKDHLIFDVGHQCYVHKLLTGRRERFPDLRKIGGLSGFPKREESVYDCFGAGHSSTSLSAAIGFAEAEKRKGTGAYTVAVIGDGAFTGGMIHEALNNCRRDLRLIIVLNENEMSISKNIGTFAEGLAKIRASEGYYKTKNTTAQVIKKIPLIGEPTFRGVRKVKQTVKNAIYGSNHFESLGLHYLGPVDGNDFEKTEVLVKEAMAYGKSCVIHVKTKKGMGYAPAMKEPSRFHSIPPASAKKAKGTGYSSFMGETLRTLADKDKKICA
ncbi:MAG: thiamine pyrophosphate-dependent enzyme, partial [Lachnospiraceae bacterium]|nr:thiamine pyrophosphate-dependent enzyme [Lachnospiraceae bacterium]